MPNGIQAQEGCDFGRVLAERVAQHIGQCERRHDDAAEERERMWNALEQVRNRLPTWAVVLISVMSALLGGALARGIGS